MSLRFLVVEDDAASREFARSSLAPFGIVDTARTLSDADWHAAPYDPPLRRMRELFLDELPQQRERIATALADGDVDALRAVLHQMRAGCGFVGATALSAAVDALHAEPGRRDAALALLGRIDDALAAPSG